MQTLVAEILAAWRRAERLAETLPGGSSDQVEADRARRRLSDLYQDLTTEGPGQVTEADVEMLLAEFRDGSGSQSGVPDSVTGRH
jgi:hypothetical protein